MTEQVSATALQGLLDQPAFTFWISANSSQPIVGELTFGAVKSKYYTGSLVKLPVDSQVGAPPSLDDVRDFLYLRLQASLRNVAVSRCDSSGDCTEGASDEW